MTDAPAPSRLPRLTLTFGLVFAAMGYGVYFATGRTTFGAMSPTFLGIPIVLCAVVANTPNIRKHAIFAACMFALVGVGIALWKVRAPIQWVTREVAWPPEIFALPEAERGEAYERMNRHNLAALVAWPLFAVLGVSYIALAMRQLRREQNPSKSAAT